MGQAVLRIRNLTTELEVGETRACVVQDISFDLWPGKTLALVGESGCGKSMTALSILRILPQPPALDPRGEVEFEGRNLLTLSEKEMRKIRGRRISMIFQNPSSALNPVYTIGDQLLEVLARHLGMVGEEAVERAVRALEEVGIASPKERMEEYPHQISGGMKQRVMIAMALLCEPDVLIADEPTTALDVTIQAQVLDLMRALQEKKGTAILLITHDMGVVAEMADDVLVMYASWPVEQGSVLDIFDRMSHPYTQALFRSRPTLEDRRKDLPVIEGSVPPITRFPAGCHFNPRCPSAMPICRQGEVPQFVVGDGPHVAKCWLYESCPKQEEEVLSHE